MRRGLAVIAIALVFATAADAKGPIDDWQGVYKQPHDVEMVDGTKIPTVDRMEIVRVDPTHAYVSIELNFDNDRACSFHGGLIEEGKQLIYRGFDDRLEPNHCSLTLERYTGPEGPGIVIHDGGDCRDSCGVGAVFDGGRFTNTLRDASDGSLETVRQSRGYLSAIEELKP